MFHPKCFFASQLKRKNLNHCVRENQNLVLSKFCLRWSFFREKISEVQTKSRKRLIEIFHLKFSSVFQLFFRLVLLHRHFSRLTKENKSPSLSQVASSLYQFASISFVHFSFCQCPFKVSSSKILKTWTKTGGWFGGKIKGKDRIHFFVDFSFFS